MPVNKTANKFLTCPLNQNTAIIIMPNAMSHVPWRGSFQIVCLYYVLEKLSFFWWMWPFEESILFILFFFRFFITLCPISQKFNAKIHSFDTNQSNTRYRFVITYHLQSLDLRHHDLRLWWILFNLVNIAFGEMGTHILYTNIYEAHSSPNKTQTKTNKKQQTNTKFYTD